MPNKPTTFFDELMQAARGCLALLTGNRQAASYFDFSRRGVAGSWIAVVFGVALIAFGPTLLGASTVRGLPTTIALINFLACGLQAGTGYLILRQMGRLDGFVPYLVTVNWMALASSLAFFITSLMGNVGLVLLLAVFVGSLLIMVNIGRFIVTLTPMQIVIFFVVQAVAVFLGVAIFTSIFLDPSLLEAASTPPA